MHKHRFISHNFEDSLDLAQARQAIEAQLLQGTSDSYPYADVKDYDAKYPLISRKRVYSDNTTKTDTTLYTGSGGVVFVYYKLYCFFNDRDPNGDAAVRYEEMFEKALMDNIDLVETGACHKGFQCPSFFQSVAGLYTVAADYYHRIKEKEKVPLYVQKIQDLYKRFENDLGEYVEDELLYGAAGYLYCLLFFLDRVCPGNKDIKKTAVKLVRAIIKSGKKQSQSNDFILVKWPRDRKEDKFYLGGAHGLIGVLQMLLQALTIVEDLRNDKETVSIVKNSCEFVLQQQFESGNFPSSLGK